MDLDQLRDLFDQQSGVVSRRQLVEAGADPADVRRWLRRGLRTIHPGVYVNHTGPLSWNHRAWAGVLHAWPAALAGRSALDQAGQVIHLAVARGRRVQPVSGTRLHHLSGLEDRVRWNTAPPRQRLEDAALMVAASSGTRIDALAVLTDVVRRRITTPARLHEELELRSRVRHRAWLLEALDTAAQGMHSVLEAAYLRRVERPHGLPRGDRQVREQTSSGVVYRDVVYDRFALCIELDGRIGHETGRDRWHDLDRDLEVAAGGRMTLRLGWWHTERDPCRVAGQLAEVFVSRGWLGQLQRCPRCPPSDM